VDIVDVSLETKLTLSLFSLAFNAVGSLLCLFIVILYKTPCPDFNPLPVTYRLGQAFIAAWPDVEEHCAHISCLHVCQDL